MSQHGLGRIHVADPRDAAFPMAAHIPAPGTKLPPSIEYPIGPILDQGQTPECVGFGWRDWLNAGPIANLGGPSADAIYHAAQARDGIHGKHDGSTVRAGAQVMQADGYLTTYVWDTDAATVARFMLGGGGCVVLGTAWLESMFTPDAHGLVIPSGPVAGGHCYLAVGYDSRHRMFHCQNSWSAAWGQHGTFYIHTAALNRLLQQQGEACAAVKIAKG